MKLVNQESGQVVEIPERAHLRSKVVRELLKEESLTTAELREKLASGGCFTACKKLEQLGIVESMLGKKFTLWDPVTRQVITRENYDAIMGKAQEAREQLTKKLKAEGLSDEEIAEKLRDLVDPRTLAVPYRTWWVAKKWKPLQ